MRNMVDVAHSIAIVAHHGQKDRAGRDYYHHPALLAEAMQTDEEKVVALLHDVLEDSNWTAEKLAERGIPESAIEAVKLLTHDPSVPYMEYVQAIKDNQVAKKVKIADLKHNLNLNRLPEITEKDIERCRKYLDALQYLIG